LGKNLPFGEVFALDKALPERAGACKPEGLSKTDPRAVWKHPLAIAAAFTVITLAIYSPSLHHQFLLYDDQQYVTENPHVIGGLTAANIRWAFGYHAANWHPLTWLSHMLDCQIFGLNAEGHHFMNILLHALNAGLLFLAMNRLTGKPGRSAFVAALFAWHPLHVESVAWIAERKDLLCAFFWFSTTVAYTRCGELRNKGAADRKKASGLGWYSATLLLFILALMSKPMAVTLPFVLLLLDYWPLRRIKTAGIIRVLIEKAPLFALSAAACFLTTRAQQQAIISTRGLPVPERIGHAALAYVHYVWALIYPHHLSVYYPYGQFIASNAAIAAFALLVCITIVALIFARQISYLPVGWFWFIGTLVPVIGFVQVGDQAWADRYSYLPSIGLFVIVAWGVSDLVERFSTTPAKVVPKLAIACSVVCLVCIALTEQQLRYWKNTRTLFEHANAVTKDNTLAITLLGSLAAQAGDMAGAMARYDEALRIKPNYPEAHFFRANALDKTGHINDAINEYRKVLWYGPVRAQAHILLAADLTKAGHPSEAVTNYEAALKFDPDAAVAHNNLARLLQSEGKTKEAMKHYAAALRLDPNLAEAHNNYGVLLIQSGDRAAGLHELRNGLTLNSTNARTELNLAMALNEAGEWQEAVEHFSKTVRSETQDPNAHYQFGLALYHIGRNREAMSQYAAALLQKPDFAPALNGLAWLVSTAKEPALRNGPQGLQMAEGAVKLTQGRDPEALKTLSAALAENGRFDDAMKVARDALAIANATHNGSLTNDLAAMLEGFAKHEPWRE
jgi:tetratricopeptide (TPR) repeat protein